MNSKTTTSHMWKLVSGRGKPGAGTQLLANTQPGGSPPARQCRSDKVGTDARRTWAKNVPVTPTGSDSWTY